MDAQRQTPRPLLELANGLNGVYQRLQSAPRGSAPSPGDRVAALGPRPGPLGDAVRGLLGAFKHALGDLDKALEDLEPWLVQLDVVLAYTGVIAALAQGGVEAGAGLASLSSHLVGATGQPDELYRQLIEGRDLPQIKAAFDEGEDAALIVPPPEDVAIARAAIARLLNPAPPGGARSLTSLLHAITRSP